MEKTILVKQKNGNWTESVDSKTYERIWLWKETLEDGTTKKFSPEQLGYVRQCSFPVLFKKSFPSRDNLEGYDEVWYTETISLKIRDECTKNLWYKFVENKQSPNDDVIITRKWYVLNLEALGVKMMVPFETNQYQICEKSKAKRISIEEAQEIAKVSSYVFAQSDGDGDQKYGITV